ncbi:hypothetical protein J3R83DRAFT_2605 [Lanmaoa asiatica]|nr:hypothetical protein J3R83DRAFT_2605 [Lanmaoa asiatica]
MSPKTFQEAEAIYDRATNLEFVAEYTSAFHLYLDAADAFLHLSRSTGVTPLFQAQCKANAAKAIQRAEKIKQASKTPGAQIGVVAVPIDSFGADHQAYVLRKSSTVNNIRYPLWNEPLPLPSNPGTRYSDPNGQPTIHLPKMARSTSITWKRSSQELSSTLTPADIYQNIISDCSVCASVAVCVQHNQRFNSRLLSSSLLPGNQSGRYDLKAHLNGGYRRVSIDDLLPFDDSGRPIGVSSGRKAVAWPALIEKAVCHYHTPLTYRETQATTALLVALHLLLACLHPVSTDARVCSTSFERERTWERLANGFRKGRCVLTVGTDAKTILKIEGAKLLPLHAYAVVGESRKDLSGLLYIISEVAYSQRSNPDVRETKSQRWVTLIDSRVPAASASSSSSDSRMLDMRWDDICATFEGIYASWDPELFQYGAILHDYVQLKERRRLSASVRHLRLLYECQNSPDGGGDLLDTSKDIWILLTRHYPHARREAEYISLTVHPEDEDDWRDMWVKKEDTEVKGPYTTSPHVLVRTKAGVGFSSSSHTPPLASPPPTKISGALSILASYDGPFDEIFFTVNVFCGADVKVRWDEDAGIGDSISPGGVGFCVKLDGTLTTKNAGGNHTHPTYMLNPQWHLRIYDENAGSSGTSAFPYNGKTSRLRGSMGSSKVADVGGKSKTGQKSLVALSAQGPREVPLNVTVVWSSGERIVELAQKEVVTSSGAYTYGRARAAADMAPGDYTVILSAFEPQIHLGQFTLKVESSHQFDLVAIPQEGAGMYVRVSKGEWDERTAVGGPSHGRYHSNPIYEVQLLSSAQFSARLHLTSSAPTATLNLSLFPALSSASGTPTLDRPLASSGPYSDALPGADIGSSHRHLPQRYTLRSDWWFIALMRVASSPGGDRSRGRMGTLCHAAS